MVLRNWEALRKKEWQGYGWKEKDKVDQDRLLAFEESLETIWDLN